MTFIVFSYVFSAFSFGFVSGVIFHFLSLKGSYYSVGHIRSALSLRLPFYLAKKDDLPSALTAVLHELKK